MSKLFEVLVEKFGFAPVAGTEAIGRKWSHEVEVVWYGKQTETYEVLVYPVAGDNVNVLYKKDGEIVKAKIYAFGFARTLNAIKATVACAGFEF